MKPSSLVTVMVFSLLVVSSGASLAAEKEVHWGEAHNEQGELVYREKHSVTREGERVITSLTEYISPADQVIATMESDYSRNLSMPTYVFEDLRRGYREGLRQEDGEYIIFKKTKDGEEETEAITNTEDVFSCQGWHYYLVNNLAVLERENVELNLILPSELRALPFEIQQVRAEGRTLLISTHDLSHVTGFCDEVVLINKTVLAYGETSEVFTEENLARTFGGSPAQLLTSPGVEPQPETGSEP